MSYPRYLHFVISELTKPARATGRFTLTLDNASSNDASDSLQAIGRLMQSTALDVNAMVGPIPLYNATGEVIGSWGFEASSHV